MKKILSFIFTLILIFFESVVFISAAAVEVDAFPSELNCKSAILMEASTGKILYEQNADERLPPASVTKIMTLLLVMEAIDAGIIKYTDMVTISANAASMGGSQVFLEEGESMVVEELLKCVIISSANDAALALAEYIAGSEEAFVKKMNERAKELSLQNTNFENTNGLDDTVTNHYCSAKDIAIMSKELIKHRKVLQYSSIWMDSIRDGAFGLTNTNRLIRFYKGATGLKTGSTSKAKFCISATAERDGMELIAVIMAAPTRDIRNAEAAKLLDWGYANYSIYKSEKIELEDIRIMGGTSNYCALDCPEFSSVLPKGHEEVKYTIELPKSISAPIKQGDTVGYLRYYCGNKEIGCVDIKSSQNIDKIQFWGVVFNTFLKFILK